MSNYKTHLRRGKTGYNTCFSACRLSTSNRKGSAPANSTCVSPDGFKATPADERCKACELIFIKRRNERRKEKGLAPVDSVNAPPPSLEIDMSNKAKVKITLNNAGGELDSVTVDDDLELSVTNALIEMINGLPLGAGDSIIIEDVTP